MTPPTATRDRGATLPIVALLLPVLLLMVAFAIDLGVQRSNRRTMQARADVIALDLARLADGRTRDEILASAEYVTVLEGSAARNDIDPAALVVVFGTWDGSTFRASPPGGVPTAVQVTASQDQDHLFQPGSGHVERTAVAAYQEPSTDLTVGSVGAGFQPSVPSSVGLDATVEALNARLAAQFGATVPNPGSAGFDLAGYRGLAAADVDIRRVAANAGFASPNELMASDVTVGQLFGATATALDQQAAEGDPSSAAAAAELRRFQTQMGVDNSATMRLGDTVEFAQGGDDAAAAGSVNVLDLLSGSADVIDGSNLASYQLAPTIPGVAVVGVQQFVVSTATVERGLPLHGTATNKQVRFQVDLQVAPLAGMTAPLRIPLVVEAATATGTVDRLACDDPLTTSEVEIGMVTSGMTVRFGTAADLSAEHLVVNRGVLIQGGGLTVQALLSLGLSLAQITGLNLGADTTATASASLLGGTSQHVFLPFQDPNPYQRAAGGIGGFNLGTQLRSSLRASVANTLLGTTATTNLVNQLAYVFDNLDTAVLSPLLAASGVTIAGADLKAENLRCVGAGLRLVG